MAHRLRLYTEDGLTPVDTITFEGVIPGTPSDPQTYRLVNDDSDGAVDPAPFPYIFAMERHPETDEPLMQGLRGVDERWPSAELTGESSDDVSQLATGIEPIGRGRVARTAELPSGGWVKVSFRHHPPASVPSGAASTRRYVFGADSFPATTVDQGHSESDRDGIIAGIGDGLHTELVIAPSITESGTPDELINLSDLAWVHKGIPQVLLAHTIELDEDDSAAAALASGEAYWARLSVGAGAAVTVTKSVKFTAPGDTDDVPAVPTGELSLGFVRRDFDAAIGTTDITSEAYAGRFQLTWTSGLNVHLGGGWALVDNALVRRQARSLLALTASQAEVSVWLLPDGNFQATNDGSRPDPRALLLFTVPTGGTDVTIASLVDHRAYIGPRPVPVVLTFSGTLTNGLKAYGVWSLGCRGYVEPLRGLVFHWHDPGSGNSAGSTAVDLEIGGADVFPSAGTEDRRPTIEYDAAPALSVAGLPEVLPVEAFSLFEATLDVSAFNGTAPSGATLAILVTPGSPS